MNLVYYEHSFWMELFKYLTLFNLSKQILTYYTLYINSLFINIV